MKRRTRRLLFWLAVLIFAVAAFTMVRNAQGYRYDWASGGFVRTGAIAVTANEDAKLFVDDRLVGSLSFLGRRAGRDRLLPGIHTVRLVRERWSAWEKDAQVSEGLLADFPSALIVSLDDDSLLELRGEASRSLQGGLTLADATPTPKASPTPRPRGATASSPPRVKSDGFTLWGDALIREDGTASGSLVADSVLGFSLTDNKNRVLWWTRNEVWVLWTRSTDYQPYRVQDERSMVGRWATPVVGTAWFRDRDHVVVDLGKSGYRVVELDQRGGTNTIRF